MVTHPRPVCLIVEPERGMRELLDDVLSVSDVQVITCVSEEEALEQLKNEQSINVVVLGAPPLGSKTGLVMTLRATYASLPLVCLSPSASLPNRAHAFESGASEYLVRPISPVTLAERVTWWSSRGHRPFPSRDTY
jgi:DNA-binding response OmpR family regulator